MSGSAREIAATLAARQSFVLTSHARPDGDAIGSQLALGLALERLGKTVTFVGHDPAPMPYRGFPGVDRIQITDRTDVQADAAVVLECSDLSRPEVTGLDRYFVVNVDHHLGNEMYGDVNWYDGSAAACGEMVADIIDALGVAWTQDIAAHLFLATSTDTGSFRYGPISARTFELCRRVAETRIDLAALSRQIFDSFGLGRVRLAARMMAAMELYSDNRLAVLYLDDALMAACGASIDDTEGLVNHPLGAREVLAVALFKLQPSGEYRVSLRSKGDVDVRRVAVRWKGGGHRNAAGCTVTGELAAVKQAMVAALVQAIDATPVAAPVV